MALVVADRVKDATTTTGVGPLTLSGATIAGYRPFNAVLATGDTVYYTITNVVSPTNIQWEVGLGTYTAANTLARTSPIASSNGGGAVNFSAGTKEVFLTAAAAQIGLQVQEGSVPLADSVTQLNFQGGVTVVDDGGGLVTVMVDSPPPPGADFRVVTGNTGTATAETVGDTLAITGGTGISTTATDTPDGLVITNTDTGSAAVATHVGLADPHPQYLTQTEANALYAPVGGSAASFATMTATQASTVTALANVTQLVLPVVVNGVYEIFCSVIWQSAATTTGLNLGLSSPANTVNHVQISVPVNTAGAATSLQRYGPSASAARNLGNVIGTAAAGVNIDHAAQIRGLIVVGNTPGSVQITFATEIANSAVTLQVGSILMLRKVN